MAQQQILYNSRVRKGDIVWIHNFPLAQENENGDFFARKPAIVMNRPGFNGGDLIVMELTTRGGRRDREIDIDEVEAYTDSHAPFSHPGLNGGTLHIKGTFAQIGPGRFIVSGRITLETFLFQNVGKNWNTVNSLIGLLLHSFSYFF